jgi:hypothetical protein
VGVKAPTRATRTFETGRFAVAGLALSGDGSYVALHAKGLRVRHVRTGDWWGIPAQLAGYSHAVAFHPTRPGLAYIGYIALGDRGVEVIFYDVAARAEVKRFRWGVGSVDAPVFSPDGLRCAVACAGKIVIWDVDE